MKVYRCDSCGLMAEDPHSVCMKEFTFTEEYDHHGIWRLPIRKSEKIHLCDKCFRGLRSIGEKALKGESDEGKSTYI